MTNNNDSVQFNDFIGHFLYMALVQILVGVAALETILSSVLRKQKKTKRWPCGHLIWTRFLSVHLCLVFSFPSAVAGILLFLVVVVIVVVVLRPILHLLHLHCIQLWTYQKTKWFFFFCYFGFLPFGFLFSFSHLLNTPNLVCRRLLTLWSGRNSTRSHVPRLIMSANCLIINPKHIHNHQHGNKPFSSNGNILVPGILSSTPPMVLLHNVDTAVYTVCWCSIGVFGQFLSLLLLYYTLL